MGSSPFARTIFKIMKILWITLSPCSSIERRGSKTVYAGWMSSLEKAVRKDINLSIAYLSNDRKQEDFEYQGVDYHSINPFKSSQYLIFRLNRLFMSWKRQDKLILSRLKKIISQVKPDLIHVHGTESCFGLIANEMGYVVVDGHEIPMAVSIQGLTTRYLEKFWSGITLEQVLAFETFKTKIKKQSALQGFLKMKHQAENEAKVLARAAYVFGRTEWDNFETYVANPNREYFNVGEIMRAPFYAAIDRSSQRKRFKIVSTVSRGIYKGYELLLKAANCLKKSGLSFEWIVIGYGPKDDMVKLAERATRLRSANVGVRLAGRQDAKAMVPLLDLANVYCHVSHIENSPNSVCEAMLRGLPVVATDVGGTSSLIDEGVTGYLYPDTDPQACADAILKLYHDPALALKMGLAAREVAIERHAPDVVHDQLLDAYKSILHI